MFFCGARQKNFCETFFWGKHLQLCPWSLALASSIPVLGLESVCPQKGCPWPRIFFVSLPWPRGLCPRLHLCVKYMIAAGITLKSLYPELFHVSCVAHLLHHCAKKIKSHFEDVDQQFAKIKAVIIKTKTRHAKFSAIGYPPQPVPRRRGSWLNAALYYTKNLPEVIAIAWKVL